MKNRRFKVDPSSLSFTVKAPLLFAKDYPEVELNVKAVIGIFDRQEEESKDTSDSGSKKGKKKKVGKTQDIVVYNTSVPAKEYTIGIDSRKFKKQPPTHLIKKVMGLHKGAIPVSVDLLNKGQQIAITTGLKSEDEAMPYEPLYHLDFQNGLMIQLYRVFLYRYDQLKNDHYLELVFFNPQQSKSYEEGIQTVHAFLPTKSKNMFLKAGEAPFEDSVQNWLVWSSKVNSGKPGDIRTMLYYTHFKARKDQEFEDKTTKKYQEFVRLKMLMQEFEQKLGNTILSIIYAWSFWFWSSPDMKNTLESDMLGYFGKKYTDVFNKILTASNYRNMITEEAKAFASSFEEEEEI